MCCQFKEVETVNPKRYSGKIVKHYFFFFLNLSDENEYGLFVQDGVTALTASNSVSRVVSFQTE